MAVLKIHSDIVDEETRVVRLMWTGIDGTSFSTVDAFIDSIPKDDNEIEIRLNCEGGNISEGWSIYDKLRATGKDISAVIEGKCASMASILLLAASKERRSGYTNSKLCIHKPLVLANKGCTMRSNDLRQMADDLDRENEKFLDLYVERTGADREQLQSLMEEDRYVDMDQAKELGFVSTILLPLSASKKDHSNINNMAKTGENVEVSQSLFAKMLAKLGYAKIEDAEAAFKKVALDLSTADGSTLTVEREEGEPQVGDTASPDGEHLMPDGSTIVVEGGVITEIRDPEEENNNDKLDAANARIAELEAELTSLRAQAKSQDELVILNKVKTMGGLEGLKKIASSYVPDARGFQGNQGRQGGNGDPVSLIDKKLAEKRDARKKKFNK
ncbi:ATP-dependent Clp protease proteolytic subunit [Parabacteroides goldsteinii]|uniref:Clp protease ClpP n=1 Tax=Parabacteroides goldsteinii TaxID=328812 RepID=UPI001CD013B5|nr:Clp protease ClpP [Parabacteroides goldsteinii]UBD77502.1 ATP-dependent Clp protease proteolytic subunit [Parabacteroides goldsteinii]